jgi:hypothetical protein
MALGTLATNAYKLAFEKSPIFLTGGLAQNIPGKTLPIIAITQGMAILSGIATGSILSGNAFNLDNFWASFFPLPGAQLQNNSIGKYPFANQIVAANSIIMQPLTVSMRMNCSIRNGGGMITKIMTATALKIALDNHKLQGGTFSVLTPSFFYQNCILTQMKDITSGESKQYQTDWQMDFEQPLITMTGAQYFQNGPMNAATNGTQSPTGSLWSGIPFVTGQ